MIKKFFIFVFRFIGAIISLIRGLMLIGILVVSAMTIYLISVAYETTMDQYNESLIWKATAYDVPLAEIEPVLVANVIDADIVNAVKTWENLEDYLSNLDGQPISDIDDAVSLLENAMHWQEIYNLDSKPVNRLALYLQLEEEIPNVYVTLDTTRLQELSQTLYNMEIEKPTVAGHQYMERLKQVSADFINVRHTIEDSILSVGTVEDGIWTIPYTYTRTDLTNALEQIQSMQKFPALCDSADVLSDIASVLNYNKNARDYFEYQEFKKIVDKTTRSRYVAVSSIYTYEQALSFGCSIQLQEQDGYIISLDSPVSGIYYKGEQLDENDYVRRGTRLTAVINEIYEPIPEPEPEPELDFMQEIPFIEFPSGEEFPVEEGVIEYYYE